MAVTICHMPHATCHELNAICHAPCAICRLPSAMCYVPYAICHMPYLMATEPPTFGSFANFVPSHPRLCHFLGPIGRSTSQGLKKCFKHPYCISHELRAKCCSMLPRWNLRQWQPE